ncbi:MAG: YjbQ family protein [Bacteroidales bacterium]|nr:YjbQ family protein [Bacteroidales bacterium]MBN2820304.1 YjbQ family protein [Bacteroidales bacterium]
MQDFIQVTTDKHNGLFDITTLVVGLVKKSKVKTGIIHVDVQGVTAGILILENWDDSVQNDCSKYSKNFLTKTIYKPY